MPRHFCWSAVSRLTILNYGRLTLVSLRVFPMAISLPTRLLALVAVFILAVSGYSQDPANGQAPQGPFRKLAPGVERTIAPALEKRENYEWMQKLDELSKLAAAQQVPELGKRRWALDMLKDVRLDHDVWALEFSFKPIRFVTVDVPVSSGQVERKLVWYMVYRVRNTGDKPVRFVPQFVLHSTDSDVYYPDRIIATAMDAIRNREDARRRLLNTVQISDVEIPPSAEGEDNSVYGVVTWRDIDP